MTHRTCVVEWLAFLLRFRQDPGSNLGQAIVIDDFRNFTQYLQANSGTAP